MLSQFTQMAGVVTLPKRDVVSFRQVEFLPLSGNRVLVILVVNEREVQNRVIHLEHAMSEEQLHQAANFINAEYVGKPLMDVRESVLKSMEHDREKMDSLMKSALEVASKAFENDEEGEAAFVVSGRSNLVQVQSDPETINRLYEAFSRKGRILHLLDQCLRSEGIQLFIGEESGYLPFGDMSVVTRTYEIDGQPAGVLGVIGPTRMAYDEIIPVVDVTAKLLGAAINYS
jgi:heat-inducible transcriptional repressor